MKSRADRAKVSRYSLSRFCRAESDVPIICKGVCGTYRDLHCGWLTLLRCGGNYVFRAIWCNIKAGLHHRIFRLDSDHCLFRMNNHEDVTQGLRISYAKWQHPGPAIPTQSKPDFCQYNQSIIQTSEHKVLRPSLLCTRRPFQFRQCRRVASKIHPERNS